MKILLADDDRKIHLVVRLWLNRIGHEVISAYNGEEALEMLNDGSFEGLITDVNMPLLKGTELVKATLALPEPPELIVVLTSRCDITELKDQIDAKEVRLFNKPFSPAELSELIEELGKNRKPIHELQPGTSFKASS